MSEKALFACILEHPDDDTIRLVYADWLDENGQGDRAEFIRTQVTLSQLPSGSARAAELISRSEELLQQHGENWDQTLKRRVGQGRWAYERGFVSRITMTTGGFLQRGAGIVALAPIERVRLEGAGARIAELATARHLERVVALDLGGNNLGDIGLQSLLASPHLRNLRSLDLVHNGLGPDSSRTLASSPYFSQLTCLDLSGNSIGVAGARAIAGTPHPGKLTHLNLKGNRIEVAGAEAIAASSVSTALINLGLYANRIGAAGTLALAQSPHLGCLESLDLGSNRIEAEGGRALGESQGLNRLSRLNLYRSHIGDEGTTRLIEGGAPYLARLTHLDLRDSSLTPPSGRAIAEAVCFQRLTSIDLRHNNIDDAVAGLLRRRFGSALAI